jgi:hypothetical protein
MTIRCKFRLTEIRSSAWGRNQPEQKVYVFTTQYDPSIPEDQRFCKATPNGKFEMTVDNPVAQAAFKLGHDYYFDAEECPS